MHFFKHSLVRLRPSKEYDIKRTLGFEQILLGIRLVLIKNAFFHSLVRMRPAKEYDIKRTLGFEQILLGIRLVLIKNAFFQTFTSSPETSERV